MGLAPEQVFTENFEVLRIVGRIAVVRGRSVHKGALSPQPCQFLGYRRRTIDAVLQVTPQAIGMQPNLASGNDEGLEPFLQQRISMENPVSHDAVIVCAMEGEKTRGNAMARIVPGQADCGQWLHVNVKAKRDCFFPVRGARHQVFQRNESGVCDISQTLNESFVVFETVKTPARGQ
ncbi:hypothetical protein D3C83_15340 [compost metagenome]